MAQNNDRSNVTVGKPTDLGAVFWAPLGTALPTGVPTIRPFDDLDPAYVNLGYVSSDGLTKSTAEDGDDVKAWGGDTVLHNQTSFSKTFTLNFIETANEDTLAFIYGRSNVQKRSDGVIQIDEVSDQLPHGVIVVYTLQGNGDEMRVKRQIVGDAQLTDRSGDETYNDSDLLAYPAVVTAFKFTDSDGKAKLVRDEISPLISKVAVENVTVAPSTATVSVGSTKQLSATVTPDGASKEVQWTSSSSTIASVSNSGLVTGKKAGQATITATSKADSNKKATATITVS